MNPAQLVPAFLAPGVEAIALFGSFARGDGGPFSDIDLVRCVTEHAAPPGAGSHLIDGRLVVVSNVPPSQQEQWFSKPKVVVNAIAGLRVARPLHDPSGVFARIQQRAKSFSWTVDLQARANVWASAQMVGWIEEAHKGLEGLRRGDVGRLINARHGLSWGLAGVVHVQRGLLVDGDNAMFEQVSASLDPTSAALLRASFGIDAFDLAAQVEAGLRLYVWIAALLEDVWQPTDAPLIQSTAARITRVLGERE